MPSLQAHNESFLCLVCMLPFSETFTTCEEHEASLIAPPPLLPISRGMQKHAQDIIDSMQRELAARQARLPPPFVILTDGSQAAGCLELRRYPSPSSQVRLTHGSPAAGCPAS